MHEWIYFSKPGSLDDPGCGPDAVGDVPHDEDVKKNEKESSRRRKVWTLSGRLQTKICPCNSFNNFKVTINQDSDNKSSGGSDSYGVCVNNVTEILDSVSPLPRKRSLEKKIAD